MTIGAAWFLDAANVVDANPAFVAALVLSMLGAGLIIGAWVGRSRGLIAIAMVLTAFSMGTKGEFALWSIIGIGLFNSIMWSNIFSLSIRGLGKDTSQGSSLLVMMIVGGAIMPLIQGALMDAFGVRASLSIVLVGYAYLVYFGFYGARADELKNHSARPLGAGH